MSNLIDYIKGQLDGSFWVLIHAHSKIILEKLNKISETTKQLTLNDIKEARVFNANDELKIWKYQGEVKSRLFSENKRDGYEVYSENMVLWGDKVKNSVLKESGKGAEIKFPVDISKYELPLKIKVENYFVYDEDGLIQFQDARLTNIIDNSGKEVE